MMPAFFNRFKKNKPQETLPSGEEAWSEISFIYSLGDFEKYNPDDLIGRKGFGIYKKMMRDEQVKAVVKFKRDAITSRKTIFELDADKYGISEEDAQFRIDLFEHIIDNISGSWMDALNNIMSAVYNGCSYNEKIFTDMEFDGRTWRSLGALKLRPFDTFYPKVDDYGNVEKLVQKIAGKEHELNIKKFVHFIMNPDIDEHYGQSELREAYRPWWSKDVIWKFRNIWLERHAGGFRTLSPTGEKKLVAGTAEYNTLQKVIQTMGQSPGLILPSNMQMDSTYPNNNVAYREAIEDFDKAIARALLVPNLLGITPQGQHGSFNQSENQLEAFFWTLEADTRRLYDVLNEQIFRQLGLVNFGDDAWPRAKPAPISEKRKMEIIGKWNELVNSGAVTATDTDEAHLRESLEFPEAGEPLRKQEPVDDKETEEIQPEGSKEKGKGEEGVEEEETDEPEDETVMGKSVINIEMKKILEMGAMKAKLRVDFAVIEKGSDELIEQHTAEMAVSMDAIIRDLVAKMKEGGELANDVKDNVKALKTDKKLVANLRRKAMASIRDAYSLGTRHAVVEIDRAKKTSFSLQNDQRRLNLIADDYFTTRSFTMAGNLSDDALKTIEAEILNGAKYDKTLAEVEKSIYETFASKGMISYGQAVEALGSALGIDNPDARLRTAIRTTTFDAINEARYNYFTDPALGDFVQAFEYSAILDSRTTQICRHLDEQGHGAHTLAWWNANQQYKPPNHHNCRSLLVPVTIDDMSSFVEGAEPTMDPQKGFM